ncbi:DUF1080 domain-containing protein [candidate division KSB1 bacterium]|nr:DUF1080 domain-containing protein [candidate division KSB1 bacterium]
MNHYSAVVILLLAIICFYCTSAEPEFESLFDGESFAGWKLPAGDNGHWRIADDVIDYDHQSEAAGEKHLWSADAYDDFILKIDWRLTGEKQTETVPVILPDGSVAVNEDGEQKMVEIKDAGDSGIYLRGNSKSQINIWCWPVGSGEVWGYRTDPDMPPAVRRAATPDTCADKPVGEWNTFVITLEDSILSVDLNDITVIDKAPLPGIPPSGKLALQHHDGHIQFRNIYIKPL